MQIYSHASVTCSCSTTVSRLHPPTAIGLPDSMYMSTWQASQVARAAMPEDAVVVRMSQQQLLQVPQVEATTISSNSESASRSSACQTQRALSNRPGRDIVTQNTPSASVTQQSTDSTTVTDVGCTFCTFRCDAADPQSLATHLRTHRHVGVIDGDGKSRPFSCPQCKCESLPRPPTPLGGRCRLGNVSLDYSVPSHAW
jgi:hypothetical protein